MKELVQYFFLVLMLPVSIVYWISVKIFDKNAITAAFSQTLSVFPGKIGCYMRSGFYRFALNQYHPNVVFSFASLLSQQDVDIASGVYIGPQCNIGSCYIGKDTLIGSGVHILSGKNQHNFGDPTLPIREQGGQLVKIRVGQNCWIGNGAIIMADVADNTIVAAGAVVTSTYEAGSIIGGNPAKVLKSINTNDQTAP